MEYLTIEIDCEEKLCGKCKMLQGGWCTIFNKQIISPHKEVAIPVRLPECIAACKEQKEFFKSNGIVEIDIRTPHTS